ncbi:MAG: MlaD family protein [Verrucomicrobiales bacterium]|nr:MlaD family protein [Verrucomicrobiales bacterium]
MASGKQRTELYVGLFVLLGILLLGGFAFQFGRFGKVGGETYPLTVKVRDASGVKVGAPVRIGGLDIGTVTAEPVLDADFKMLAVEIEVREGMKIPRGSEVNIGTSGLMGDRFIRILPPEEIVGGFYESGEEVAASSTATIDDVATGAVQTLGQAEGTLEEIGESVGRLNEIFRRFDEGVLDTENIDNLKTMLASLRVASERIEEASERFGPILDETSETIESVKSTAEETQTTLSEVSSGVERFSETLRVVDPVILKFDDTLNQLRGTLQSVDALMSDVEAGEGLANALLNDEDLRRDLSDFVDKLERNGILFYPRERKWFEGSNGEKKKSGPKLMGKP